MANALYDQEKEDQKEQSFGSPNDDELRDITGISPDEEQDMDAQAELGALEDGFAARSASPPSEVKDEAISSNELKSSEENPSAEDKAEQASLYKQYKDGRADGKSPFNRRRAGIITGVFAGVAGLSVFAIIALLPLKLQHIMANVDEKAYGAAEQAVEKRLEYNFSEYIIKKVYPSMSNCPTSKQISMTCAITQDDNTSMKGRLFNAWRDGHLETKLKDKYGIYFIREGNNFSINMDGKTSPLDVAALERNPDNLYHSISDRGKIRKEAKQLLQNETKWKQLMYRFKVGRLLERKYGIRRCLFFCKTTDKFDAWKDSKKTAAKKKIIQRVIIPHTQNLGVALQCIVSAESCGGAPKPDGTDEERRTKLEKDIKKILEKAGQNATNETVDEIIKIVENYNKSGSLTQYIVQEVVTKLTNASIGEAAGKSVPIIGYIDFASKIINQTAEAGTKFKRLAFGIGAASMVGMYVMYRSHADELKNGKIDFELLGSVMDTLGSNDQYASSTDPAVKVRAGQTAETSPLYSNILGTSSVKTSLLDDLSPSAYAESETRGSSHPYTCDNGNALSGTKLICPEESLLTDNFITQLSDLFKSEPLKSLHTAAKAWSSSLGAIYNGFTGAVGGLVGWATNNVPFFSYLSDQLQNVAQGLFKAAAEWLIPSPISDTSSGARNVNMIIGGAEASASDYGQYGLGGRQLSQQEVADIQNARQQEAKDQFASQSLYARLFNTNDSHSLISRVALALPSSTSSYGQYSFASLLSNPLSKLGTAFGSLFAKGGVAFAADNGTNPFGIPTMSYSLNDPVLTMNSDILTDSYCKKLNKTWAENDVEIDPSTGAFLKVTPLPDGDSVTGTDIHHTVNPCKLQENAEGTGGGLFSDDTLTKADLSDPGQSSSSSTGGGGTASSCTLSRDKLVEQIFAHEADGSITYDNPGPEKSDISDPTKTTDQLVCVIWSLLEQGHFKIIIGAINSDHQPGGDHGAGKAVDLARSDDAKPDQPEIFKWLFDNAKVLQIHQLIHQPVPSGSHMINTDIGGDGICDEPATGTYPNCNYGAGTLGDHYSHIHVGVQ